MENKNKNDEIFQPSLDNLYWGNENDETSDGLEEDDIEESKFENGEEGADNILDESEESASEDEEGDLKTTELISDFLNDQEAEHDEGIIISKAKVSLIKNILENIKEENNRLIELLSPYIINEQIFPISIGQLSEENIDKNIDREEAAGKVIEGVFDGENMIGPDGKKYTVPSNYASKSKLVEGDIMKLTIATNGTYVYKQIGPIDRARVVGVLERTDEGSFVVTAGDRKWRIITASVTYYKGKQGDEVIILVPKIGESNWAAVENIVKNY
ncbi:MAG: hypothetical protein PHT51_03380 [Patescibacteria group bacterium]|nr:hypothetical protein [Patescibacteria group bacterium]MDD4611202.1 hypothetical protein [Patescibacteria group bacterium]